MATTSILDKKIYRSITVAGILLLVIMALSFALHMANIDSIGDANAYYTAAVESMLRSWHNFFFVAAEPGGSVTVDKPPLGLWIEASFAYFLGVSGFSVSLPNILAGVAGIPVLYLLVKKYMGKLAGLVAALVMALTPVYVATNRNNTMDGMLVFFLLLAAWAFIKATESKKLGWLLLGAFIVGLGFNIKMLQAFLPLPAFYALYFFGARDSWLTKTFNLGIATALLIAVSLSWAVVVDLTPTDQRPYIGSSDNNTVMGLIFGHNGISRLEGNGGPGGGGPQDGGNAPPFVPQFAQSPNTSPQPGQNPRQGPPPQALDACAGQAQGSSCSFILPTGNQIEGGCVAPPNTSALACAPQGPNPQNGQTPVGGPGGQPQMVEPDNGQGGTPFSNETGSPGLFRFFTQPLSKQMSWLLPFALISVVIALFASRLKFPLEAGVHRSLLLWGGWLMTCVVFFSMVSGIFHAYYAIMLAPALGAMVGIGFSQLWTWLQEKNWAAGLLMIASVITFAFQVFAMVQYGENTIWLYVAGLLLLAGGALMLMWKRLASYVVLLSLLVIPAYWTVMTTQTSANQNLPTAYSGIAQQGFGDRARQQNDGSGPRVDQDLADYLQSRTQDVEYLVAVPSSQQGSGLVLATGRPVLYMGGFGGQDEVVDAEGLAQMVADEELRYVLYGGDRGNKQDVANWLSTSCSVVPEFSSSNAAGQPPQAAWDDGQDQANGPAGGGPGGGMTLYLCGS